MASVFERYEYDSYGQPYIMSSTYQPRAVSPYGNNFLFTGRETDMLDSGSLKIQSSFGGPQLLPERLKQAGLFADNCCNRAKF
jgi:hypothetical protein